MSDNAKCRVCVQIGVNLPMLPPPHICTGRPGCFRAELREAEEAMRRGERPATMPATEPHPAAGTEDIATRIACVRKRIADGEDIAGWIVLDGDAVAVDRVSWDEMCAEITRLRAENERLTKERDEARRHVGALRGVMEEVFRFSDDERDEERLDDDMLEIRRVSRAALANTAGVEETDRHARDVAMVKAGIEAAVARLRERVPAILNRVAELPDRSSPEDWPEAMLVTEEELGEVLVNEIASNLRALDPAAIAASLNAEEEER